MLICIVKHCDQFWIAGLLISNRRVLALIIESIVNNTGELSVEPHSGCDESCCLWYVYRHCNVRVNLHFVIGWHYFWIIISAGHLSSCSQLLGCMCNCMVYVCIWCYIARFLVGQWKTQKCWKEFWSTKTSLIRRWDGSCTSWLLQCWSYEYTASQKNTFYVISLVSLFLFL